MKTQAAFFLYKVKILKKFLQNQGRHNSITLYL